MEAMRFRFLETLVANGVVIAWYLYHVVKKDQLIPTEEPLSKTVDMISKVIVGIVLCIIVWKIAIPVCKDIPGLINRKFYIISGESQSHYIHNSRTPNGSAARIKDEKSGEIIKVSFYYEGDIWEGDHLTVQYLPNSKYGVLLEINGKSYRRKIE